MTPPASRSGCMEVQRQPAGVGHAAQERHPATLHRPCSDRAGPPHRPGPDNNALATTLNEAGHRTGTGQPFDGVAASNLRSYHHIPTRPARRRRADTPPGGAGAHGMEPPPSRLAGSASGFTAPVRRTRPGGEQRRGGVRVACALPCTARVRAGPGRVRACACTFASRPRLGCTAALQLVVLPPAAADVVVGEVELRHTGEDSGRSCLARYRSMSRYLITQSTFVAMASKFAVSMESRARSHGLRSRVATGSAPLLPVKPRTLVRYSRWMSRAALIWPPLASRIRAPVHVVADLADCPDRVVQGQAPRHAGLDHAGSLITLPGGPASCLSWLPGSGGEATHAASCSLRSRSVRAVGGTSPASDQKPADPVDGA